MLLHAKASVLTQDKYGQTPVHAAAAQNRFGQLKVRWPEAEHRAPSLRPILLAAARERLASRIAAAEGRPVSRIHYARLGGLARAEGRCYRFNSQENSWRTPESPESPESPGPPL